MFFRQFAAVNIQLKYKLSQVLCMDFYGVDLMEDFPGAKEALKKLAVSYHYYLKGFLHLPKCSSNHLVCSDLNALTFQFF